MGTSNYSDDFKRDAVQQIRVRGYLVRVTEERDILKKGEPWIAIGSRAMANAYFAQDPR
jgi:hypothetical protein